MLKGVCRKTGRPAGENATAPRAAAAPPPSRKKLKHLCRYITRPAIAEDDQGDAPLTQRRPASAGPGSSRVFAIDMEHCPHCGGPLAIIAAIEHPPVIAKILAHLGLPIRAPPRSSARAFDRLPMA